MLDYEEPDAAPFAGQDVALPQAGVNVTWYHNAGHMDPVLFIDQFKGAWPWQGDLGADADAGLPFDADGYPLATPENGRLFSKILKRSAELDGIAPFGGDFRVYGQGDGRLRLDQQSRGDLLTGTDTATLPTEVIDGTEFWYFDFTYDIAASDGTSNGNVRLTMLETDPADHLRDMSLIHHSHLDEWRDGAVLAPELVSDLSGLDTLRFMEWAGAHKYEKVSKDDPAPLDPERRHVGPDHFTFNTRSGNRDWETVFLSSAPIEAIVELANLTGANPWISLPVDITDTRMMAWAEHVDAALDPDLEVYWEYGNELWNWAPGFQAFDYALHMAKTTFGADTPGGLTAVANWDAYRGPQLFDIIAAHTGRPDAMNYVAAMWAHDGPYHANGRENPSSYSNLYWAAEAAGKMADAPSRPAEIITDYAVGLYAGGMVGGRGDVIEDILARHDTESARAETFARWLTFGTDPETFVSIGRGALDAPVRLSAIAPDTHISVADLVRRDQQDGHNVVADLDRILRLAEDRLQYRGAHADSWTTVAIFDTAPGRPIEDYIASVNIVGIGFKAYGDWHAGVMGGLRYQTERRLDQHVAFVEEHGLDFVGYEGGVNFRSPRPETQAMLAAFEQEGWYAAVMDVYYDRMSAAGLDLYAHHMSHERSLGFNEHWGLRDYVGQPLADAPKATWLLDKATAAAGSDDAETRPDADTTPDTGTGTPLTGADGIEPGAWRLPDGGAVTPAGDLTVPPGNDPAIGTFRLPETRADGDRYTLSMTLDLPDPGEVRLVLRSLGGGTDELLRTGLAVDGSTPFAFTFDGSDLAEMRRKLRLVVSRVDSGEDDTLLTVSDFTVTRLTDAAAGSDDADTPSDTDTDADADTTPDTDAGTPLTGADGIEPGAWRLPDGGAVTPAGDLTVPPGNDPAIGTFRLPETRADGDRYTLSMTLDLPDPGEVRLVLRSLGGGTDELLRTGLAVDGSTPFAFTFDGSDLAEARRKLRLVVSRVDSGEDDTLLTVSDFTVTRLTPSVV